MENNRIPRSGTYMTTDNPNGDSSNWFRRHRNLLIFSGLAALYLLPFMTRCATSPAVQGGEG